MDLNRILAHDRAMIEDALRSYVAAWPNHGPLRDAMSYSLLAGGKRVRPVLVLEVCHLFGGDPEVALPFACAVEMVHTYSLIHDDLPCMDDDDLRRGKPTSHKVFGEAHALLAGDALLTAAFETVVGSKLPPERLRQAIKVLARAAGPAGMVGGQVLDLEGEGKTLTYEEIVKLQRLKTGCLLDAAARLGAIAAESTDEEEEAAASFARKLGLAFQIRDDILDVTGDEASLGKPVGSDEGNEKSTFVTLRGLEACQELVTELTEKAIDALAPFQGSEILIEWARKLAGRDR